MTHKIASRRFGLGLAVVLTFFGLSPASVQAVPIVGYSLQISEGVFGSSGGTLMAAAQALAARDVPLFTLVNTSTEASITQFSVTIGDTNYNFDAVTFTHAPGGPQVTSFSPDSGQGGAKAEVATLNFSSFTPNRTFNFRTDIDPDNGNFLANFRQVFGGSTLAKVTVTFSDRSVLTNVLSQFANGAFGSIHRCESLTSLPPVSQQQTAVVPEPSGLLLALFGASAFGIAVCYRRRHR